MAFPSSLQGPCFHDPRLLTIADLEHSETEERWFSIGCAANGAMISTAYVWSEEGPAVVKIRLISARKSTMTEIRYYQGKDMKNEPGETDAMPADIDFGKSVRGLHFIPSGETVLMPTSIEKNVWEYFSGKAAQRGIELSALLTEVLKRDIEINEALK